MSKINEMRESRAKAWENAKKFLDSHRNEKGILSAEDTRSYEAMEKEIVDLGKEIERELRREALEKELNTPVNTPLTNKPEKREEEKKTRFSSEYKKAF